MTPLQQQNLAISYTVEPMGNGAFSYNLHNSRVSILTDNGGITLYEKRFNKNETDILELTDDEAFILYSILKERYK